MRKTLLLLAVVVMFTAACHRKISSASIQQKAQHMVVFYDKKDRPDGECTATAIGPHAILTAQHCNDDLEPDDTIRIDLSVTKYHLLADAQDGHDHVIYLLDGPAFRNYLPLDALTNVKPITANEAVFIYGSGRGIYPPRLLTGRADAAETASDVSDVDQDSQMTWYALPVIPGDSGSAIYAADGRVVGLVTYSTHKFGAAGFALCFSEEALRIAHFFHGGDR